MRYDVITNLQYAITKPSGGMLRNDGKSKMKIEVTDATTLPEWLQGKVADGHLDLGSLTAPEDVAGLKGALQKERENTAAYSKFGKPADIQTQIDALTEKAKGNGKGADDAQAKLDAMSLDYEGKLTARDERITKMMTRGASSDLKAELAKAGFVAEAIDDIAISAMNRLQFNEDGSPKVMTFDGKPMIGNGADHGATLADLAKELAEAKPYAVRSNSLSGGGKPPSDQGGKPDQVTVTRAQFDSMSHSERSAHATSGGAVKG
jgi:hypothetical protein